MLEDNKENIEATGRWIHKNYIGPIVVLLAPISMASCYGGVAGGGIMLMEKGILIKALGAIILLMGLSSIFWLLGFSYKLMKTPGRKLLRNMISFEQEAARRACNLAQGACYYNATTGEMRLKYGGAIAINPLDSRIAIVTGKFKNGSKPAFTELLLSPAEIIGASVVQEAERMERGVPIENTGLLLRTTNLQHHEIFINFDPEDAKPWLLLFEKIKTGTLEVPNHSIAFPFS